MNHILKIIGKILLGFLAFLIFSFFVYWFKMYNDDTVSKGKGLDRVKESFGAALLYYVWGLLETFTGDLSNPFNFFLSIYGIDSKDFKTMNKKKY